MQSVIYTVCLLATMAVASPTEVQRRQVGLAGMGGMPMGGLGGMGGGATSMSQQSGQGHQAQSSSTMTPWGGSQSSSESSYAYSSTDIQTQFFNPLLGSIGQLNGMIGGGSFSMMQAQQMMSQIAMQLQGTFGSMGQCACIGQGGISSAFGSVFSQLTQAITSMSTMFGMGNMGTILSPLGQLGNSFSSFSSQIASSQYSQTYSSFLNPFIQTVGPMVPGLGSAMGPMLQ
ncbi:hypothetical protein PTTG_10273 [Puccinia triticina 1-1 BBBD Race 1]|uniref:Uncharacterized protein n=2 Tax=Puccinia triticina TaxID=208348 RepID=A0A180GBF2_PUCT1|nr:uncharacterized protein PtA15_13A20 [Puccinia triticina]OAV89961.1 hypothetical protein PTTG_10273 [Puccinia triticina 1-1 BBBD Race 1]WAQ90622.1 hypothetical protein PtA15_13A20 [Puccinia triticina]WAR60779.1 hypothetical protein PtB15_13B23 [Puccinia triticina]